MSSFESIKPTDSSFILKATSTAAAVNNTLEELHSSVKNFETQFAQGQLEAIVFNDYDLQGLEDLDQLL